MNTAELSIGFNFDHALIDGLKALNGATGQSVKVGEVFGALIDCPLPSARPTSKIPDVGWREFEKQVQALDNAGIKFNFLMNAPTALALTNATRLKEYLKRLLDVGITRITVGTTGLAQFVRDSYPSFHLTMSITFGTSSLNRLRQAEGSGVDAVYLDAIFVNRDFRRLRELVKHSTKECRLYANVSCIAGCPVARDHYRIFGSQDEVTGTKNTAFFAGCSMVKLNNPVEWIQMPWIRPEDLGVYGDEGIRFFKLSDRLAPTSTLLAIAAAYVHQRSPSDLFTLIERDGSKYRSILPMTTSATPGQPLRILSERIGSSFMEHFRQEACDSRNRDCQICRDTAGHAIEINNSWPEAQIPERIKSLIPSKLSSRILRE